MQRYEGGANPLPPFPWVILLILCYFQCPPFQWQECGIARSILKENLEGHQIPGNECLHSTRALPSYAGKSFNISKFPQRACTLTWSEQVTFLKYLAVSNVPGRQHITFQATLISFQFSMELFHVIRFTLPLNQSGKGDYRRFVSQSKGARIINPTDSQSDMIVHRPPLECWSLT